MQCGPDVFVLRSPYLERQSGVRSGLARAGQSDSTKMVHGVGQMVRFGNSCPQVHGLSHMANSMPQLRG